MTDAPSARTMPGQPLLVIGAILALWVIARLVANWPEAEPVLIVDADRVQPAPGDAPAPRISAAGPQVLQHADAQPQYRRLALRSDGGEHGDTFSGFVADDRHDIALLGALYPGLNTVPDPVLPGWQVGPYQPVGGRAGPMAPAVDTDGGTGRGRSFQLYGWSFLRPGGGRAPLAGEGRYGGSQAGVIVRYLPWRTHRRAPALFARITTALTAQRQETVALGITARPFAPLPLDIAVEQRVALGDGGSDRPAAFIAGGFGPRPVVENVVLSGYGQAGIVGLTDPRGFFDLSLLAERPVVRHGATRLLIGAGVWSGGETGLQADAAPDVTRLDVGPHASVRLPIGQANARLDLDWRQRVAGNARPGSGLAVTLSAGF